MSKYNPEYHHKYYTKNRDKILEQMKQHYQQHREEKCEYDKLYRQQHRKEAQEYRQQYWEERNEYSKIYNRQHRAKINEYERQKRATDIRYKISQNISRHIRYSLKSNKDGKHWETLVDYTVEDLIKHLKKTIPNGYIWQDYINGKLQIDHIIPVSAFNFTSPEHPDFRRCWALKNLQLLPAEENLRKKNKLSKPFQPALELVLK